MPIRYPDPGTGGELGSGSGGFQGVQPPGGLPIGRGEYAPPSDLQLILSPDGLTLTVKVTVPETAYFDNNWTFRTYWIPGNGTISLLDIQTQPFSVLQAFQKFVVDQYGGQGAVLSTDVNAKIYTDGWMYTISVDPSGKKYPLSKSGFVAVPVPLVTAAPANDITTPLVNQINFGGNLRQLQFFWVNPAPLDTAAFVQIWISNYFNDGTLREGPVFAIKGSSGQSQGPYIFSPGAQSFILETDQAPVPAHNVTFYFAVMSSAYVIKGGILNIASRPAFLAAGGIS